MKMFDLSRHEWGRICPTFGLSRAHRLRVGLGGERGGSARAATGTLDLHIIVTWTQMSKRVRQMNVEQMSEAVAEFD